MFSIFLKKVNKIFKLLLMITGFLSILSLIIILFYGDTSHMRRNVMIDTMKSMFGIGTKYEAFVANTPKKFFKAYYLGVINSFKNHNIPELEILINFKKDDYKEEGLIMRLYTLSIWIKIFNIKRIV